MKELIAIQSELKVPKGRWNRFGNFYYRSAEDILEAVKPLLHKYGCLLYFTDDVGQVGEMHFVKTTVTLIAPDKKEIKVTAVAAHELSRKAMDLAQVSGSTSSYARKYALCGLFLLDDERDPDSMPMNVNPAAQEQPPQTPGQNTPTQQPAVQPVSQPTQQATGAIPPPPPVRR